MLTHNLGACECSTYDFDYGNRWTMVFVLVGWCVGFHILTALCLAYINHLKR